MQPSGLDISSPRRSTKNINNTCPNPYDTKIAREFLLSLGVPRNDLNLSSYSYRLEMVGHWLQVKSSILCKRHLTIKERGRQTLTLLPSLWDDIKLLSMSSTITRIVDVPFPEMATTGMYTRPLDSQLLAVGWMWKSCWKGGLRLSVLQPWSMLSPSLLCRYQVQPPDKKRSRTVIDHQPLCGKKSNLTKISQTWKGGLYNFTK